MAHHKSAKKAIRQSKKATLRNSARKNRIRTFIKKVEAEINQGNKSAAQEVFKVARSEIMQGVKKNLLKLNTASRRVSRLAARIKSIVA